MKLADIVEKIGATVGMRKGEYIKTLSLFFYLFLIIASYVVSKTVRDALYLSKFGALKLPYVYIGIAVLAGVFVSVYLKISNRFKQHVLLSLSMLFFSANVVLFWSLFKYHFSWLFPVIYIWAGIFGVIGPMQVWTLGSSILTTREAKRLYGFIGSGGILGGIAGGFFSSSMVPLIGTENLLLTIAAFMLLCIPLINIIYYRSERGVVDQEPVRENARRIVSPNSLRQSWSTITHCRYLFLIAGIISLGSIVTTIVDWQFKAVAEESINSKDQLTAFFGNFYGYLGIASFLIQILFTSRMMRRFGIGFTLLLLPIGLTLGSIAMITYMSIATAIILKGPDQLFKHSIDRSTIELLYLPVPTQIKASVKSFIDTIIWRFADGVAGIILLLLTTAMTLTTREVSFVNLGLICLWLVVAFVLKREYISALRAAIDRQDVDPTKLAINIDDTATIKSFITTLQSNDEREILYALDLMDFVNEKQDFIPHLEKLMHHPSPAVRARVLNLLNEFGDPKLVQQVKGLINDTNPAVQAEAIDFMRTHDDDHELIEIKPLLQSKSFRVKGAAVCLILNGDEQQRKHCANAHTILQEMISNPDNSARQEAARVIGELRDTTKFDQALIELMRDNNIEVAREALQSAGKLARPGFIPQIIEQLARKQTRLAAREALTGYQEEVLPTLRAYLNNGNIDLTIRKTLPQVISQIGSPAAVEILREMLDSNDSQLRWMALKGLNKMRVKFTDHENRIDWAAQSEAISQHLLSEVKNYYQTLTFQQDYQGTDHDLLRDCLERRMELQLERIFRLLGLIYSPTDLYNAYQGLSSGSISIRANALELLDNLLSGEHQRLIIPIIDEEVSIEQRLAIAESLGIARSINSSAALAQLLHDEDPLIVSCAIDAIYQQRCEGLYEQVEQASRHEQTLIRETAEKVITQLHTKNLPYWSSYDSQDLQNNNRGH